MKDKLYDNADSFAMSFDEEWKKIECKDLSIISKDTHSKLFLKYSWG